MEQYLRDHELELNEMKMSECHQVFRYGPSKQYVKRTMVEKWNSKIDTKNIVLETEIDGTRKDFKLIETTGNHVAIEIERKSVKEEEILFAKEGERLDTFKAIRKVHEVTNHKSAQKLIKSYRN